MSDDKTTQDFTVVIDDWLAIYTFEDGHTSIRITENWSEWGLIGTESEPPNAKTSLSSQFGYLDRRIANVLKLAIQYGPAPHDPKWCEKCNFGEKE